VPGSWRGNSPPSGTDRNSLASCSGGAEAPPVDPLAVVAAIVVHLKFDRRLAVPVLADKARLVANFHELAALALCFREVHCIAVAGEFGDFFAVADGEVRLGAVRVVCHLLLLPLSDREAPVRSIYAQLDRFVNNLLC
jgi:hypothetical protein